MRRMGCHEWCELVYIRSFIVLVGYKLANHLFHSFSLCKERGKKGLAFLMNCGVVLGFYCWGWEFLTALLLFSS